MRKEAINIIRCPNCSSSNFKLEKTLEDRGEIRSGKITCVVCKKEYPVREGITDLLYQKAPEVIDEQKGWVSFSEQKKLTELPEDYLLQLPRPTTSNEEFDWERHANNFEMVAEKLLPLEGKLVLDIGAGRCWSTRYFANHGAKAFAVDILTDPKIGLGAADVLMKHDRIYFERVLGDMNNLPFKDGVFDVVFFTGALHHSEKLFQSLKESARVLKDGGKLALTNEACTGLFGREWVGPAEHGIHEHNYKYARYLRYLKNLGLKASPLQEADFYRKHKAASQKILSKLYELKRILRGGVCILIAKKTKK